MCFLEERERQTSALRNIVSMSPPGYPSAWLHPCRARFRFAWQNHCSSLRYLPINSTDEADFSIAIPQTADPGTHWGVILVKSQPQERSGGSAIQASVGAIV